ncbi:MAG: YceD family protein [Fibrobacterota bacterium]
MKIDLRKIRNGSGNMTVSAGSAEVQELLGIPVLKDAEFKINADPVAGGGIAVRCSFVLQLGLECSRCLGTFKSNMEQEFGFLLSESPEASENAPDEYYVTPEQELFDFSDAARQNILLEIPMNPVCGEDCSGICSGCGKDLNTGKCVCAPPEADPRWEKLAELKNKMENEVFNTIKEHRNGST